MKTIAEIRAITENTLKERENEYIEACTKFIENTVEPNILAHAKNGYVYTFIAAGSLSLSQIDYIMGVYAKEGYKVRYAELSDDIVISWRED